MTRRLELTGQRFGRLTVLESVPSDDGTSWWRCLCDCGSEAVVRGYSLTGGVTKSCGCLHSEVCAESVKRRLSTHNMTGTPIYQAWGLMRSRCNYPKDKAYARYGGRGIRVCERWDTSFENFYADMGSTFRAGLTLDRIDNDGDYEPDNCRWATRTEQSRNRRCNHIITVKGESACISEMAERYGLYSGLIHARLRSGWSEEESVLGRSA